MNFETYLNLLTFSASVSAAVFSCSALINARKAEYYARKTFEETIYGTSSPPFPPPLPPEKEEEPALDFEPIPSPFVSGTDNPWAA